MVPCASISLHNVNGTNSATSSFSSVIDGDVFYHEIRDNKKVLFWQ